MCVYVCEWQTEKQPEKDSERYERGRMHPCMEECEKRGGGGEEDVWHGARKRARQGKIQAK